MNIFARFAQDESGATAIEYGLIAALISVVLIAGASLVGTQLNELFGGIAGKLDETSTGLPAAPAAE